MSAARRLIAWSFSLLLLLLVVPASAQTDDDRAGARAAAAEGAKAFRENRFADAIDFFSRAESLIHAPPHLLYMARAHVKLGKLVKGRELYLKIIREDMPGNAPKAFRDAQKDAAKELKAVEPKLAYVTVNVEGAGGEAVTVTQDGVGFQAALIGVPRPVDPGDHEFQARTSSKSSAAQKVNVAEGKRATITLTLEAGGPAAATPAAGGGTPAGGQNPAGTPETGGGDDTFAADTSKPLKTDDNTLRYAAYGSFAVGAIGIGAGVFFLIQSGGKEDDANALFNECAPRGCTAAEQAEVKSLDDDAASAQGLSIVSFIVGGLGVAGGVTLLVLSSKDDAGSAPAQATKIEPWVGLGSAGVRGTF